MIALLIVLIAVVAPLVVPYPADAGAATHPEIALQAPSAQHLFGTDQVGRDVFSRVLVRGPGCRPWWPCSCC